MFAARLDAAGLTVDGPLPAVELSAAVRVRSDPARAAPGRHADPVAGRGRRAGRVGVGADGRRGRTGATSGSTAPSTASYRVAGWPQLPVGADWLGGLLTDADATRTVTVVMEPVPMRQRRRAADREVMPARPTPT